MTNKELIKKKAREFTESFESDPDKTLFNFLLDTQVGFCIAASLLEKPKARIWLTDTFAGLQTACLEYLENI